MLGLGVDGWATWGMRGNDTALLEYYGATSITGTDRTNLLECEWGRLRPAIICGVPQQTLRVADCRRRTSPALGSDFIPQHALASLLSLLAEAGISAAILSPQCGLITHTVVPACLVLQS